MSTVSHLVNKFLAFYGTRSFITALKKKPAIFSILKKINPVINYPSFFFYIVFTILFSLQISSCKRSLSYRLSHVHSLYANFLSPIRATCPVHLIPLPFFSARLRIVCWEFGLRAVVVKMEYYTT
jgi:hypothetical protein